MKLYPTLRYDDPRAAHEWLQQVIGFESVSIHEGKDGTIEHAEMRWGEDLIMFGSSSEKFPKLPVIVYVTCDDPDAAHAKAKAAGGEITMQLVDQDYGNREFAVRDPEGHTWSFGTYEPR
ncbi:MAG: VOC family protein [Actinomycetota bacterium]|nr:VOC family protein [Actinomycetota bacterium]